MLGAKILLADNNRKWLRTWSQVLERKGYEVTGVGSFEKAKKILAENRFDVAVVDLHLVDDEDPDDLSGLNLAEMFGDRLPVIIITGLATVHAAVRARQQGKQGVPAVAFVQKTDPVERFLEAVALAFKPRIFIAHGHDLPARDKVVKLLERGGVQAIVLQEEPGASQAVLEKFEEYSDVHFAIALMTPDDLGAENREPLKLQPRARQNVIFELGYFLGKLGRRRVVALRREGGPEIEPPSNYGAVLSIAMDSGGGWQLALAKELRKVGIEIKR
jgi:predicted nucleotide-binding protein